MPSSSNDSSNHSARPDDTDASEALHRRGPPSFGQRHALKIMAVVMALMFGTVVFAQVAC
jgi:hypothetical protein